MSLLLPSTKAKTAQVLNRVSTSVPAHLSFPIHKYRTIGTPTFFVLTFFISPLYSRVSTAPGRWPQESCIYGMSRAPEGRYTGLYMTYIISHRSAMRLHCEERQQSYRQPAYHWKLQILWKWRESDDAFFLWDVVWPLMHQLSHFLS